MNPNRKEGQEFEDEVRRIARELWPYAQYAGATTVDDRERDGIFETEDCIHLVEATISRRKEKSKEDAGKLSSHARRLQIRKPTYAIKCWLVTRDEPTADQRTAVEKFRNVILLSFSQLQSRLINVRSYLAARKNYPFGSVRDPGTEDINPTVEYIPLDMLELETEEVWPINKVHSSIAEGVRFVILGDYGAGKSMTLRHVYQLLSENHLRNKTSNFPVYLNLRDHWGQTEPAEVLERHARNVGFDRPPHLVRAWRAGYVILLIDGFDELASLGFQGLWKKLKDVRYRAMTVVRRLAQEHPAETGLMLAGRAHFFDSHRERKNALDLDPRFVELSLSEFTNDQIKKYLKKSGLRDTVPAWIPSRPLLVGYLAGRRILPELVGSRKESNKELDPVEGWGRLLDSVTAREAKIEAGIDGQTVRQILERLATCARSSVSGLGPVTTDDLLTAFKEICGYSPEEGGMAILQRLPGLGVESQEEGTRGFVDEAFADACRAGDLVGFITNPYGFHLRPLLTVECVCEELAIGISRSRLATARATSGKLNAALRRAQEVLEDDYIAADIVNIMLAEGFPVEAKTAIGDILIPTIDLDSRGVDFSNLQYSGCYFARIGIDIGNDPNQLPHFTECYIGEIDGVARRDQLPAGVFEGSCVVDNFSSAAATSDSFLDLDLPLGIRVLLTALKKLYRQKGSGRKENAFYRGLDHRARRLVPDVLRLLQTHDLAYTVRRGGDTIWLPDRSQSQRVGRILLTPASSQDLIVTGCSKLD